MKREKALNLVGVGMIAVLLVYAAVKVSMRAARELDPEQVTIRFSHWQVEPGMREAFDAVIEQYEALNPNVRVEQLPCPGDVYGLFVRTRLVGGDPPELMELGRGMGPERMVRHFQPFGAWLEAPNPYNEGTPLEGTPWRETFLDGLSHAPGLDTLFDYYAVAISGVSSRMYYNLDLYREIMGHDRLPTDLRRFMRFCEATRRYRERTGSTITPVAGSSGTANVVLRPLFQSQTQELASEIERLHTLRTPSNVEMLLDRRASLDQPAIRRGFELVREVGRYMPEGFMSYNRDDAIFAFSQGRAVSLPAGSWDFAGIRDQTQFPIGVAHIPLPEPDNTRYGEGVTGRPAESSQGAANFYLSQAGAHPEQAVDFLRYLTSIPGQRTFVRVSTWLPAVRNVKPHPDSAAFAPDLDGYAKGLEVSSFRWGGGEVYRVFTNKLYLLFDRQAGVRQFLEQLAPRFPEALASDVQRELKHASRFNQRQDAVLAAYRALSRRNDPDALRRLAALCQIQNDQEAHTAWMRYQLARFGERHRERD